MNIYLIRHGQVDTNLGYGLQQDIKSTLDTVGNNQARLLSDRISNYDIDIVFSSQYDRSIQTATIINNKIKKQIEIYDNLNEINMGDVVNKGWDDVKKDNFKWYNEWIQHKKDIAYPNGESGKDVNHRTRKFLKKIIGKDYNNIAIVTHGGVIRVILSDILGLSQAKRFSIKIDNCSISKVCYSKKDKSFCIEYINDTSHLEKNIK